MWTVIAFISSVLVALIIGVFIGMYIAWKDEYSDKKDKNLSKMTDEEIKARYVL